MASLLVLKQNAPSYVLTRDFQFVLNWCIFQCQKVFEVDFKFVDRISADAIDGHDYVLLMGKENLLFGEHSLRRMKDSLDTSHCPIVPVALDHLDLRGFTPLNTLKDFERVESLEVNQKRAEELPNPSLLPISLWAARQFRDLIGGATIDFESLSQCSNEQLCGVGVYHKFFDPVFHQQESMLDYIPADVQEVLEVGCGSASTGKLIEERLGARVTGVEKNPHLIEFARRNVSRVILGDVETVDVDGPYDFIYATDILEHLLAPDKFLIKMRRALNPHGAMLLSVPNIGHFSVVEALLNGRWDYVPGAINYEHYRFFTGKTLHQWFSMCGYSTIDLIPQKTPLPERFEFLPSVMDADLESLSTYKFYCVVKKS